MPQTNTEDRIVRGVEKHTFHYVSTMIWETMGRADQSSYSRAEAQELLVELYATTRVLVVKGEVVGTYGYYDSPNTYDLAFFVLSPKVRATRNGYRLYQDMKSKLSGKPVMVKVYSDNIDMVNVVKRRGVFIGRTPSRNRTQLDYYSIMFNDFNKGRKT